MSLITSLPHFSFIKRLKLILQIKQIHTHLLSRINFYNLNYLNPFIPGIISKNTRLEP